MHHRITVIKYLALLLCCVFFLKLRAQNKPLSDTSLIKIYLKKGNSFSTSDMDSASHYEGLAEKLSAKINNEDLLMLSYYLKVKINYFIAKYSIAQEYLDKV